MKAFFFSLCYLLPAFLYAQSSFQIEGKATQLKNGDKVYLVYSVDDQQITDSALVTSGSFSFTGSLRYPVLSRLFLNKNPYVAKLAKGEKLDYLMFYLEPRNFKLVGKDSLSTLIAQGSPENVVYADLKLMLKQNNEQFQALRNEYDLLPKDEQKDSVVLAGFIAREQQLFNESYQVHLNLAKKHLTSYVGLISLAHVAAQPTLKEAVSAIYYHLPLALRESPLGKTIPLSINASTNTQIGAVAVDFEQNNPSGKKIKLSGFRGKYVLIDFWASWCGPCRTENPNLVVAYQNFANKGFEILGVSLDQPGQGANWIKAIKEDKLSWPQVSDLKGWDNEVAKIYGVRSIPASFLIDPSGKIIAKDLRGKALIKKLEEIFNTK